jgi:hypothetical protein
MTVAEWTFVSADGSENSGVANVWKDVLLANAVNSPEALPLQDREKFKVRVRGLNSAAFAQITVTSVMHPEDYYVDTLAPSSSGGMESTRHAVLYHAPDDRPISESQRSLITGSLGLNAVRNAEAQVVATTQAGDAQIRQQELNAK